MEKLNENLDIEVKPSEINTSSFKIQDELTPKIWKNDVLNPQLRLKLLDIADDFFETLEISWVKPIDIILTGSICNFNWSEFSDIDLHIVIDFREIGENSEFVETYMNAKKNEWNEQHNNLTMFGYPVELYVQDINADAESGGVYSLEKNQWISNPNNDTLKDLNNGQKSIIKICSSSLMNKIDEIYDAYMANDDEYALGELNHKLDKLTKKIKNMRQLSLKKHGEMGLGNIIYKVLRRTNYLDKMWDIKNKIYDKINSLN